MSYKLGSLFDGSGGFPLSGTLCDIEPMWAAEVEPYPIAVTKSRFPNMKHLGDISKVNGANIEPVDIITFGSPCQDLSVAGKRAGLKHEDNGDDETTRSGLFMEAVRIIKEMRKATNGQYPRFAVWENVPGAFSSNNGEDFRIVLQELIKVTEPYAVMPEVPKSGWAYADTYRGDGWSIAYRVFDAQFWGVPQRRRRIYLVADFRGECAEKILFEREGLRGYFEKSRAKGEAVATDAEGSIRADDKEGDCFIYTRGFGGKVTSDGATPTLEARAGTGGNNQPIVAYTMQIRQGCDGGGKGALIQKDKSATLLANNAQYLFQPVGADPYNGDLTGDKASTLGVNCGMSTGRNGVVALEPGIAAREGGHIYEDVSGTLRAKMGDNQMAVAYGIDAYNQTLTGDKAKTLNSAASDADHVPCVMEAFCKSSRAKTADDATTWKHADVANTLNVFDQGEARANEIIVMATQQGGAEIAKNLCPTITAAAGMSGNNQPVTVYAIDQQGGKGSANYAKNVMPTLCSDSHGTPHAVSYGLDRASFNQGQNAKFDFSILDEQQPTLTARGPGAVSYSFDPGASRDVGVLFIEECGKTLTNGTCPGHHDGVVISQPVHTITTGSFTQIEEEKSPTLMARDYKDPTCVELYDEKSRTYIVRRLTPTECARLQGFPDKWGHIEPKSELTDEEYEFWVNVRKTHDAINDKAPKEYNEKQMLTWYNKLWTDSAEYKMWGNGIALPCALYAIQGIKEALVEEQTARSKWLDELLNI